MGVAKDITVLRKKKAYLGRLCVSVQCLLLEHCLSRGCSETLLPALALEGGWHEGCADTLQLLFYFNSLCGKVRSWQCMGVVL